MKKFLFLLLCITILFTGTQKSFSENISIDSTELNFAMNYFSILYHYDVKAAEFGQKSQTINNKNDLATLFNEQKLFVKDTIQTLNTLKPSENYKSSYTLVINGLIEQDKYLQEILSSLNNGVSFEEAFVINSWNFINAKKNIEKGINELKIILDNYSQTNQIKILSAAGITEEQLVQDAYNCEYIKTIQDNIK
ncbi:MAG: hypothetical protein AB1782_13685 [Cyanobacteriota bacterium]